MKTRDTSTISKNIAVTGMMIAVTAILGFTPLGTINLPGSIQITIAQVPAIIAGMAVGPLPGFLVGLSMGIISLIRAIIMPTSPFDVFFADPLVSIPARMLIGVVAFLVMAGVRRLLKSFNFGNILSLVLGSVSGVLTNTAGVLGMLYIMHFRQIYDALNEMGAAGENVKQTVVNFLLGIVAANGVFECIAGALLSTFVVLALQKARIARAK